MYYNLLGRTVWFGWSSSWHKYGTTRVPKSLLAGATGGRRGHRGRAAGTLRRRRLSPTIEASDPPDSMPGAEMAESFSPALPGDVEWLPGPDGSTSPAPPGRGGRPAGAGPAPGGRGRAADRGTRGRIRDPARVGLDRRVAPVARRHPSRPATAARPARRGHRTAPAALRVSGGGAHPPRVNQGRGHGDARQRRCAGAVGSPPTGAGRSLRPTGLDDAAATPGRLAGGRGGVARAR